MSPILNVFAVETSLVNFLFYQLNGFFFPMALAGSGQILSFYFSVGNPPFPILHLWILLGWPVGLIFREHNDWPSAFFLPSLLFPLPFFSLPWPLPSSQSSLSLSLPFSLPHSLSDWHFGHKGSYKPNCKGSSFQNNQSEPGNEASPDDTNRRQRERDR